MKTQQHTKESIHFAEEQKGSDLTGTYINSKALNPWKILIIDDEKDIHYITEKVLLNFTFQGKRLTFLHAYSKNEAHKIIQENPDIAIVLLDVVLENENAGLELIHYIRKELKNHIMQVVIRTGQPGYAPEQSVIDEYDINDYKTKTELTAQKLYTLITTSLRAYRIKSNLKKELEKRKQIEQSLRKSEERLKDIVTSIGDWIWEVDNKLHYTYISHNIEAITGYSYKELMGDNFFTLMSEESRINAAEIINAKIAQAQAFNNIETWIQKKDNTKACFLVSGKPIKDENNVVKGYRGVNKDITDLKKAEKAKATLIFQLRQAQRLEAIGTLAGGIAHDFNNILGAILGYTQLLQMDIGENKKAMHYTQKILGGCDRAKNLILQILDFSRHNKKNNQMIAVSPSTVTKEALKLLRSSIPSSIKIKTEIADDAGYILADPAQLNHMIINLCTNAYQAIEDNEGTITIKIRQLKIDHAASFSPANVSPSHVLNIDPGDYITISVIDDGRGMGHDMIDKIFDPYFTTRKGGDGTGLGLAVVSGIVAQCNGYITAESQENKGSKFTVYFPKYIKKEKKSNTDINTTAGKGQKIIFIDDEDALVELGKSMLEKLGYNAVATKSGVEALKIIQYNPFEFDIVITDMTMPDIQGSQLALKIKEIRPDLPVILSTGFSNIADSESASPKGIDAVIAKPFTMSSLAHAINKILTKS